MTTQYIWQQLNHDTVINVVEETLKEKLSNLFLKRNSYINRVYELEKYDPRERFIVKFYRPGRWTLDQINEEHQFLFELQKHEIPVIPPLTFNNKTIFMLNPIPYAIFPKKGGRALDEFDNDGWEEIGRLLARIHLIGETHKKSRRITWKPSIAARHHIEVLLSTDYLPEDFKRSFMNIAEMFIKKADPMFNDKEFILLHGDCHKGNLIHRPGEGIYIVDFDDICFGPPVQDVWMLLPDKPDKCENEIDWLEKGYNLFRPFDRRSMDLVPYLRGMRIIHFASWLAIQSKEPDFGTHFPDAGSKRYWNELIKELQEITF